MRTTHTRTRTTPRGPQLDVNALLRGRVPRVAEPAPGVEQPQPPERPTVNDLLRGTRRQGWAPRCGRPGPRTGSASPVPSPATRWSTTWRTPWRCGPSPARPAASAPGAARPPSRRGAEHGLSGRHWEAGVWPAPLANAPTREDVPS